MSVAQQPAPHVVMVVGNRVVGDSRVEKAALSAHAAGYRVTVLGLSHRTVERVGLVGPVPVFRVMPTYAHHKAWALDHSSESFDAGEETRARADSARAENRARRLAALAGRPGLPPLALRAIRELRLRLDDVTQRHERGLVARRSSSERLSMRVAYLQSRAPGGWRRTWPLIRDLEDAFSDALVELAPDLIHVHDVHPLPAAVTAAGQLSAHGHPVQWVYDAHEWLPGVTYPGPGVQHAAWSAVERNLAPKADAVVTVSEQLSVKLRDRLHLTSAPRVVTNAPFSQHVPIASGTRSDVRRECGLDETTPLLAYAGRISAKRGLATAVRALPAVEGVHLAVVASEEADLRDGLRSLADEMGVGERLHIVDYVPAESVTWYLSTATAGISPLLPTAAHHEALATKIREFLHAGLPIVGSDVRAQADFLRESGTGTVFAADDPEDCARAITALLDDLDRHLAAVTPELLAEHSWERQERVLLQVYAEVLGATPREPARAVSPRPLVSFGPAQDGRRTSRLAKALAHAVDADVDVFAPRDRRGGGPARRSQTAGEIDERPLREQLDEYGHIAGRSSHLVLESMSPLFAGLLGDADAEIRHLRERGKRVVVLVHAREVRDPHPALDASVRERLSRQVRRQRKRLASLDVPVLVEAPDVLVGLPVAVWLPYVVRGGAARVPDHSDHCVIVLAGPPRWVKSRTVEERLEALAVNGRIELRRAATTAEAMLALDGADVLVDELETSTYGELACEAMAAGCVVLGQVPESVRRLLPLPLPVLDVTAASFDIVLDGILVDGKRRAALVRDGREYVRHVHDGRRSAAILAAALELSEVQ